MASIETASSAGKALRVGVIGYGAAGAGLAKGLSRRGASVSVYCSGPNNRPPYSPAFERQVADAGGHAVESLDRLGDADVVFFAAVYQASAETAKAIATSLSSGTVYADISNAPPPVKSDVCEIIARTPALYADVGVLGDIAGRGPEILAVVSGPGAEVFCKRMKPLGMDAHNVGEAAGKASLIKMFANVFTKGMAALAFELMLPAERLGLTEDVYRYALTPLDDWPLSQFVTERLCAPAIHAPRRALEMAAVVTELERLGFDPVVTRATRDMHLYLTELGTREAFEAKVPADWRHALQVIARLAECARPQQSIGGAA